MAYTLAGQITTGAMKGRFTGTPRSVVVISTEDSWDTTIVPRLMAAGADLDLVHRVDLVTAEGIDGSVTLPSDLSELEQSVQEVDAAMVLLDPLMSRLSPRLDSHKDAEVRQALEPLTAFAKRLGVSVLGIIHVNKSGNLDPLNAVMASKAFTAVARAVLFCTKDPENKGQFLFGLPKNNLGPTDPPSQSYRVVSAVIKETDDGPIGTGKIERLGEIATSIEEAMVAASGRDRATTTQQVAEEIRKILADGDERSAESVLDHLRDGGVFPSDGTLNRASQSLGIVKKKHGNGAGSWWGWTLPAAEGSEDSTSSCH